MQNCISDFFLVHASCIIHHCIISALMFQKLEVSFFPPSLSGKLLFDAPNTCIADKKPLSSPKVLKRLNESHCHAVQGKLL